VSAALAHQNTSYQSSRVGRAARDAELSPCRSQTETLLTEGNLQEDLALVLKATTDSKFDTIAAKNAATNAKEDAQTRLLMRNYADTTNILCPSEGTAFDHLTMDAFFCHQQELLTAVVVTLHLSPSGTVPAATDVETVLIRVDSATVDEQVQAYAAAAAAEGGGLGDSKMIRATCVSHSFCFAAQHFEIRTLHVALKNPPALPPPMSSNPIRCADTT
jgi:hypothetical protein